MSASSREERQRLKEEYKAHYRQLLEQKKKLGQQQRLSRLMQQARDMDVNPAPVLERVQQSLGTLQEQIARAEARLEVYLDDERPVSASPVEEAEAREEAEAFTRKQAARDLIKNMRQEMNEQARPAFSEGLQDPVEQENQPRREDDPGRNDPQVRKTIGHKTPPEADQTKKEKDD